MNRDDFFSNIFDKNRLIQHLVRILGQQFSVKQVPADADVDMVVAAIDLAAKYTSILIGDDTDLQVFSLL